MILIYVLLYCPIIVLIAYSFNKARYSMQWTGFTFDWYQILLKDNDIWSAFINSVILGISASLIATISGLLACVHLFLYQQHKKSEGFFMILLILIMIPDIVLGVALLIFFNFSSIPLGFPSLLIAHITFCLPFVILTINTRLRTLDANIYLSALDLGASPFRALISVLFPLLFPAILSAALLSFTLSFDDVVISYFVSGPEFNILPLAIYSLVRSGVTPELNAIGTITFLVAILMVLSTYRLPRKNL